MTCNFLSSDQLASFQQELKAIFLQLFPSLTSSIKENVKIIDVVGREKVNQSLNFIANCGGATQSEAFTPVQICNFPTKALFTRDKKDLFKNCR